MDALFEGVRVLDLTSVIAGPLCTYHLALCGADVIKIEPPGTGDLARKMGADPEKNARNMGTSFLTMNSGKKSITINLKTDTGKAIFRRLVKQADVLVENYRPGTMRKLGLHYEALREVNGSLIYCAVSGFGQDGPLSRRPCYDQIIQGLSGLMSVTGSMTTAPTRVGYVVCDTSAAVSAAFAIAAALFRRQKTGAGQMIDVSMLDVALSTMASSLMSNYLNAGVVPQPMGNENLTASPSGTFKTADGLINIVNNEQKQFEALAGILGRSDLVSDERFASREARLRHRAELNAILEAILATDTAEHWEERLAETQVPVGRVLNLPQVLEHPQVELRQTVKWMDDVPGVESKVGVPRLGFHLNGQAPDTVLPPPELGRHTDETLRQLGYSDEEVESFRLDNIV